MNYMLKNRLVNEQATATGLLIGTAVLWSFGGFLIKWVSWNPIAIAGMRSAIAALLLLAFLRKPKFNWSFPQIAGAFAYAATVISFVCATKLTTAANAILLQYTAPIYIAVFGAWFLKERTKLRDWMIILSVMAGMTLFFLDNLTTSGFYGNIIAIFSGFGFACTIMLMRKQKDGSPLETILLGNIITALAGMPFMLGKTPDMTGWAGLLLLGVFQLGLSYILYSTAIKYVTALEAVLIPAIEPILNPIWVYLLMREKPGRWALLGGLVVLIAISVHCILSAGKKDTVGQ